MKIYQVDAFTDKAFRGNPAAVCILSGQKEEQWLQNVAQEMNLSETAFLIREEKGWRLRWFTPLVEVDLCGHATLASAHILWEKGYEEKQSTISFDTRSGILKSSRDGEWIELDFPSEPASESEVPDTLLKALNVKPGFTGKNRFDYIVEVGSEEELRALDPNFMLLRDLETRGVIVTSLSGSSEYDFVSRFFAPACGIEEDPVTGSAHCCLGPFWQHKTGRDTFTAYQASKRGGYIRVHVRGERTRIAGKAITVLDGELIDF